MTFRLVHTEYDKKTQRAYIELRETDADGSEIIAVTIFSYKRQSIVTKPLEQDLAIKARDAMRRASVGLDGEME